MLIKDATSFTHSPSGASSLSMNHTLGVGAFPVLVLMVSMRAVTVSSATYNSINLTKIRNDQPGSDVNSELWYLPTASMPAPGTYTLTVNGSVSQQWCQGAVTFFGFSKLGANAGNNGTGTSSSVSIATNLNEVVVDAIGLQSANSTITPSGSQSQLWQDVSAVNRGAGSQLTGASGSVSIGWSFGSDTWAASAVSLIPTHSYGFISNTLRPRMFGPGLAR